MKTLVCVIILSVVAFTHAQIPTSKCILRSRHRDGTPAICRGFVGAKCPNPSDTCPFLPGASFGHCCLGCSIGNPLIGRRCGGWAGDRCPVGYRCVTDPFIADSEGMCCRRGGVGGGYGYRG